MSRQRECFLPLWTQGPFSWCWRAAEVGAGHSAGGESSGPGGWKGAELSHGQEKEGWGRGCRPGSAGAVPPAVSGKQISWAMAGVTQMETKNPSIFGQRAQRGPDPQPAQTASPIPGLLPCLLLGP